MSESEVKSRLHEWGYGVGVIPTRVSYQAFQFLLFTFYYTVMKINTNLIMIIFILFSIFNAFNDPIIGVFSDQTKTNKFGGGRRRPWIIAMTIPLSLIMILFFTPPLVDSELFIAIYFLIIMCLFDTIYTFYELNFSALYPEMFCTDMEREKAGVAKRVFLPIALIIATVLLGILIEDMTNIHNLPHTLSQYQITGMIFAGIIFIGSLIFIKYGIKELPSCEIQREQRLQFFKTLKNTIKNKNFVYFSVCAMMIFYVFGLFPMIIPIYATHVLGVDRESYLISLLMLCLIIFTIPGVCFWRKLDAKVGSKRGLEINLFSWIFFIIPFLFLTDYYLILIITMLNGFWVGGSLYFIDRNMANIIDEDFLNTGQRREGAYFGIFSFLLRFTTILIIISISMTLSTTRWQTYNPKKSTVELVFGLQALLSLFPIGAIIIGTIFLMRYRLDIQRVGQIQAKLNRQIKP